MSPGSKIHGANMGPTWVLSSPGGPHVGPMKLAIWVDVASVIVLAASLTAGHVEGRHSVYVDVIAISSFAFLLCACIELLINTHDNRHLSAYVLVTARPISMKFVWDYKTWQSLSFKRFHLNSSNFALSHKRRSSNLIQKYALATIRPKCITGQWNKKKSNFHRK